jgi:hypothetical protein
MVDLLIIAPHVYRPTSVVNDIVVETKPSGWPSSDCVNHLLISGCVGRRSMNVQIDYVQIRNPAAWRAGRVIVISGVYPIARESAWMSSEISPGICVLNRAVARNGGVIDPAAGVTAIDYDIALTGDVDSSELGPRWRC